MTYHFHLDHCSPCSRLSVLINCFFLGVKIIKLELGKPRFLFPLGVQFGFSNKHPVSGPFIGEFCPNLTPLLFGLAVGRERYLIIINNIKQ